MSAIEHERGAVAGPGRFDDLKERCALIGVELRETMDDRGRPLFIAVKWALVKHLQTLDALADWVAMVDGKAE